MNSRKIENRPFNRDLRDFQGDKIFYISKFEYFRALSVVISNTTIMSALRRYVQHVYSLNIAIFIKYFYRKRVLDPIHTNIKQAEGDER